MASTLVRGKYVICSTTAEGDAKVIEDGAVFQRDGEIVDVGPYRDLKGRHQADEEIGSTHHVVFPGLVNAHHHAGLKPFQLGGLDRSFELWLMERMGINRRTNTWRRCGVPPR